VYASGYTLGPNFTLGEFPCFEKATASDVSKLAATVQWVLQPIRNRWGPVVPTSWMWWRKGCTPRTGAHSGGGTVDFVVPGANLRTVFDWGVYNLDFSYVGRWIYEPATPDQGEHIHMASRADMVAVFGDPNAMAYVETGPGEYSPVSPSGPTWGGPNTPIEIPGLEVTVAGAPPWMAWVLFGALAGAVARRWKT